MTADELIGEVKKGDAARVRAMLEEDPALACARGSGGETPLMTALYYRHQGVVEAISSALARTGQPLDIFAAAALGRLDALEAALAAGQPVDGYAYDGWTALHLAAFFGHRAAAERLLAGGASLGAVSRNSLANTPLHAAVAGGHVETALLFIERGADVNATDAGRHTPLHIAAEAGYVPVVKALLERGADPHAVDVEDRTPLARAAARNHTAVVDVINRPG